MSEAVALDIGSKVVGQLPTDGRKEIDPLTMIQIGMALISLFKQCKQFKDNPSQGLEVARNPNLFQRMRLRRTLRQGMGNTSTDLNELVNAALSAAQHATEDDIKNVCEAAV